MSYFHAVAGATASKDSQALSRIGVLIVNLGTPPPDQAPEAAAVSGKAS